MLSSTLWGALIVGVLAALMVLVDRRFPPSGPAGRHLL
jgi:hypothetical protein